MWVEKRHHAFIKSQASTKDYAKSSSNPIRGGKYLLDHLIHFPANARLFLRVNLLVCLPPAPCVTVGLSFCLWAVTGTWTIFLVFQNRGFSFYLVLAYEKKNNKKINQPTKKQNKQSNKQNKTKKDFLSICISPAPWWSVSWRKSHSSALCVWSNQGIWWEVPNWGVLQRLIAALASECFQNLLSCTQWGFWLHKGSLCGQGHLRVPRLLMLTSVCPAWCIHCFFSASCCWLPIWHQGVSTTLFLMPTFPRLACFGDGQDCTSGCILSHSSFLCDPGSCNHRHTKRGQGEGKNTKMEGNVIGTDAKCMQVAVGLRLGVSALTSCSARNFPCLGDLHQHRIG